MIFIFSYGYLIVAGSFVENTILSPLNYLCTFLKILKKLKIEPPYDPAIPLLGIYPEKAIIQKEACTTMFIAALFTITRTWNQPKCPLTDDG